MAYQDLQRELVQTLADAATTGDGYAARYVPMVNNYADAQRCLTTIAFLSPELIDTFMQQVIEPLRSIEPDHHHFTPKTLHTTLKNIRIIHDPPTFRAADIARVKSLYGQLIPTLPAYDISFEAVVRLPTSVAVMGFTDERLKTTVQALDRGLKSIGLADDKTYASGDVFFANSSVVRFTHPPSEQFLEAVRAMRSLRLGGFMVREVALVSCDAVMSPESLTIHGRYQLAGSIS
jgi:hypothetical protein